jgi:hypothetical protein
MGKGDRGHKETKKPKKDAKKFTPVTTIMTTPTEVEVIKKGKQRDGRKFLEEEEE